MLAIKVAIFSNAHDLHILIVNLSNNNIYLTSKIYNSAVNQEQKMLIKFDKNEYWCELLNVSNVRYKP